MSCLQVDTTYTGINFTVISNHKPNLDLLNKDKGKSDTYAVKKKF